MARVKKVKTPEGKELPKVAKTPKATKLPKTVKETVQKSEIEVVKKEAEDMYAKAFRKQTTGRDAPQFYEVVGAIASAQGEQKIKLLKQLGTGELKQFLGYVYDPRVKFTKLKKLPHYVALTPELAERDKAQQQVWDRLRKNPSDGRSFVYWLTDHGSGNLKPDQLASKWSAFLATISIPDAKLFEHMFYKVPIPGITRADLENAYPEWTKDWPK